MKYLYILFLILFLSASTGLAQAGMGRSGGGMGAQHGKIINSDEQSHNMANLRIFLNMSDEQLERMESAIRQIREMNPGEKEALRNKLEAYTSLPKHQRDTVNQAWGKLDQKIKDAWRTYVDGLGKQDLDDLRAKMDALSHSDRFEFRMNLLKEKGLIEQD